jgi:hypothetical protein
MMAERKPDVTAADLSDATACRCREPIRFVDSDELRGLIAKGCG